jgi:hypothetical protein
MERLENGNGDTEVGDRTYILLKTKPNTYDELKHKPILCSSDFYVWVKEVSSLTKFDSSKVADIAQKFQL